MVPVKTILRRILRKVDLVLEWDFWSGDMIVEEVGSEDGCVDR